MPILSIILFCILFFVPKTFGLTNDEISVMIELQAQWGVQLNWDGSPSCNWTGVVCNPSENVIELNLSDYQLTGSIPSSIINLSHLIVFNISKNYIEGSIPTSIGSFQNISIIDFSSNIFDGFIPKQIRNLDETLTYLDLSLNQFSGVFPQELCQLSFTPILFPNGKVPTCPLPSCCQSPDGLCGEFPSCSSWVNLFFIAFFGFFILVCLLFLFYLLFNDRQT